MFQEDALLTRSTPYTYIILAVIEIDDSLTASCRNNPVICFGGMNLLARTDGIVNWIDRCVCRLK